MYYFRGFYVLAVCISATFKHSNNIAKIFDSVLDQKKKAFGQVVFIVRTLLLHSLAAFSVISVWHLK